MSGELAVCCSVLQCVAVCCSVQCLTMTTHVTELFGGQMSSELDVCCSVLQCVAVRCSALQCVAVFCSVLQCYNDYTSDRVVWWSNE